MSLTLGIAISAAALAASIAGTHHAQAMLPDFSVAFLFVAAVSFLAPLLATRLDRGAGAELSGHRDRPGTVKTVLKGGFPRWRSALYDGAFQGITAMSDQKPLRFVTLLGSLRKASFNGAVARALPALAPDGVTIEALGSIGDFPLYNADIQAEGFPGAVLAMGEAITKADGVVIVTPEYNYSMPGGLKNALDWLSRLPAPPLAGKPTAIQTGSPGLVGGARAQYHLRQSLVFLDAIVLNKPEVMISQIMTKVDAAKGELTDEATRTFITSQLSTFAALVRRLG